VRRARRAVFLDRDGVLNELVCTPPSTDGESPLRVADVRLMPGVTDSLAQLRDAGWLLAVVTNQPAAAKGSVSVAELEAIQGRVMALVGDAGISFDAWRTCLHHPNGTVAGLACRCECRKPSPGMLLDIAHELNIDPAQSWTIGDTDGDIGAGRLAGTATALVTNPLSAHKRSGRWPADVIGSDLREAVMRVLDFDRTYAS